MTRPRRGAGVLDQVRERALERRAVAPHGDRLGRARPRSPPASRASSSSRTISVRRGRGLLAREHEQVVGEPASRRRRLAARPRARRSRRAAPGSRRSRAAPSAACAARATRRRGSGARPRARVRAPPASRSASRPAGRPRRRAPGCGQPPRASPVRSISAAARRSRAERPQGAPHEERERGAPRQPPPRAPRTRRRDARSRASRRPRGRRRDDNRAARGRPARRRRAAPRRRADRIAAELGARRTLPLPDAIARSSERLHRQDPAAERERPGDDPAATVDHLDAELLRRRARRRAHPATSSSAGADALSCATSPRGRGACGRATGADGARRADRRRPDDDEREQDRERRRERPSRARERAPVIGEHEADAADGVDQRRLAELAAEIGDVLSTTFGSPRAAPPQTRSSAARGVTTCRGWRSSSSSRSASRRAQPEIARRPRRATRARRRGRGRRTRAPRRASRPAAAARAPAPAAPRPRTASPGSRRRRRRGRRPGRRPRRGRSAAGSAARGPWPAAAGTPRGRRGPAWPTSSTTRSGADRSTAASAAPPSAAPVDAVALRARAFARASADRRVVLDDEYRGAHTAEGSALTRAGRGRAAPAHRRLAPFAPRARAPACEALLPPVASARRSDGTGGV